MDDYWTVDEENLRVMSMKAPILASEHADSCSWEVGRKEMHPPSEQPGYLAAPSWVYDMVKAPHPVNEVIQKDVSVKPQQTLGAI
ncbi:unnamed protein product [Penicillium roqueforti FM164]|uniref:Genomic scaffold, ProqFM164S02 n=1 Tax=Penicillium roqueforti (strain FM164) TaxID=1365484 RepID=W6QK87_PENRF|nr:unnamed protein product [Penicillium roqueforti FM164]